LLTGLYLTVVLRGLQFRQLGPALHQALIVRSEPGGHGDITHFAALMTAMAATVGTGNIVGVATAIALGGPGRCSGCGSPAWSAWRRNIARRCCR
jgi:alanine or glycine:cation symporter, AGCS family